ncbi:PREDICTED: uncharacterized protein LOC105151148 [Acromyrmex echinatior]|uniref:uncharacterized protein LOC105151148 n=1 Tax=Acromyrmex echinatior TaxID=103372 RepID=UPI000580DE7C|nr:PREDICTED: uncharacterized protein LOC105151148 [Acromyrmex echinatior]
MQDNMGFHHCILKCYWKWTSKRIAKEWQKTWRDWKANVLKKRAKSYAGGTGGGPPKVLQLTELENLLEIIDPEATDLDDMPEGRNFNRTIQKGSVPINNTISKRESFHTSKGLYKTTVQEVELKKLLFNFLQMKRV